MQAQAPEADHPNRIALHVRLTPKDRSSFSPKPSGKISCTKSSTALKINFSNLAVAPARRFVIKEGQASNAPRRAAS